MLLKRSTSTSTGFFYYLDHIGVRQTERPLFLFFLTNERTNIRTNPCKDTLNVKLAIQTSYFTPTQLNRTNWERQSV